MRKLICGASGLLMSGLAFAARQTQVAPPSLPDQIMQGFNTILAGSVGLKIAVAIIFVAGFAVGWWKESSGGF